MEYKSHKRHCLALIACAGLGLALTGCLSTDGMSQGTQLGGAKNTVGSQTQAQLVKCPAPLGTAALVEQDEAAASLQEAGLPSPIPLIRLMMTRSGCFQVVDRGQASDMMRRERALKKAGQLKTGSGPAEGQMVAADFIVTPHVVFSDAKAGGSGFGSVLGAFLPGIAGIVAGGIRTENLEAQTVLTLTNVTTGIQESVAEGSARKKDIGFAFGGVGGIGPLGGGAVGGAYESTDLGKIVSASFLDAFNKLIASMPRS